MIIIQDYREKHGHHNEIETYCNDHNILLYRMKLDVGDYMVGEYSNGAYKPIGKISVDTKQDLQELAGDLYRDKLAFNKKYKKCFEQGIKLYVLVQQPVNKLSDIVRWKSTHTKVSGRLLLDLIDRLRKSYGVKFVFCDKSQVAQSIINILTKEI